MYAAGEKETLDLKLLNFQQILKLSKTQVIIIKNYKDIQKFLKKNLVSDEIIIGMGAGVISKHMRELETFL